MKESGKRANVKRKNRTAEEQEHRDRSYTTIVKEHPETKNVTIRYSIPDEGVKEEEFEMVVLSVGSNPPAEVQSMAEKYIKKDLRPNLQK